jgi:hypothetical protein
MKSPFALIKVKSEGTKRLALLCSVISTTAVLGFFGYAATETPHSDVAAVLIIGGVCGLITFFVVGYLVTAIAWVIEGFRKNDSNSN